REVHRDEHAGLQRAVAVRERRLAANVAGGLIELRLDGADDAFEPPLRVRIRGRSDREPFGERAEPLLRQRELDVDGIERLQRDDRRALREEIADADAPDADLARERRPHDLLRY